MSHPSQVEFCLKIRSMFPDHFKNKKVLDVGSLDINGSNRIFFENCNYTGLDLDKGKNVDVICEAHKYYAADETFDTIISTECFEHDMYLNYTLNNIVRMLKPGGLFLFTCATLGRPEHGTSRTTSSDSPFTSTKEIWKDYYRNITEADIKQMLYLDNIFSDYKFNVQGFDIRFYGIKYKS